MSGLAGIFKFDPRDRVAKSELMDLARGIDRVGPNGGGEHAVVNVGMAYRAYHTTPESNSEIQPLLRSDCVLTWDGRLDNREEIRSKVSREYDATATDVDLVFAAYAEWGTNCFAELMGDWALALWDGAKQQVILARDYIGVRRLFYRLDQSGVAWCSVLEPLVLTSPRKLHLDPNYLAGCLYPRPPLETTPYREIRSVVPASFLIFQQGGVQDSHQYWSLNPQARIRYSTDAEYEEHFFDVFRASVGCRLRADQPVLAELSGGLDSSSIVCMADDIRKCHPGAAIETLSYYDTDEPGGDERPYFTLVEQKRGCTGHHVSTSDLAGEASDVALSPLPDDCFSASPGLFAQSLRWSSTINEIQARSGARVILSGLGGDELLGGVQYEAPELANYLFEARLCSFVRSIYRWSLARKKTVFQLLNDSIDLLRAAGDPDSLHFDRAPALAWARVKPQSHWIALRSFALWRELSPPQVCLEWIRYSLAQQLTCTEPPLVGCAEMRYPYLDRSLFHFLAAIPRIQVLQAGQRRRLMRRALHSLVPHEVLYRKTKWFGRRSTLALLRDRKDAIESMFRNEWLSDGIIVDAALVRKQIEAIQHGALDEATALYSAIGIEQWLRSLMRHGSVELTTSSQRTLAPSFSAEATPKLWL